MKTPINPKGCTYLRYGRIWWIKYPHNGKSRFESSKSTRRNVAEKLLMRRLIEAEKNILPNFQAEKTKFRELSNLYIQDYHIHNKRSIRRAKQHVANLMKHSPPHTKAHAITSASINEYIAYRKGQGISNATINRELAALKRMFNLALQNQKVTFKPHILRLEENNARTGFFEHDEFLALRAILPKHLKPVVTLAYYTGMRKAEILNLQWKQVNLTEGFIELHAQDTKTKQGRVVYLNDAVWSMLVAQKKVRDTEFPDMSFVFYTPKGMPVKSFCRTWASACKAAQIPGKIFHDFRRTAIRNMVRAGTPERVAMAISGHKSRSVFDRYNIVNDVDLKLAAKRIQSYTQAKEEALRETAETIG